MWEGHGWRRTRRQLGFFAFLLALAAEAIWQVGFPIGIYSLIAALLGLDLLDEAFQRLKAQPPDDQGAK